VLSFFKINPDIMVSRAVTETLEDKKSLKIIGSYFFSQALLSAINERFQNTPFMLPREQVLWVNMDAILQDSIHQMPPEAFALVASARKAEKGVDSLYHGDYAVGIQLVVSSTVKGESITLTRDHIHRCRGFSGMKGIAHLSLCFINAKRRDSSNFALEKIPFTFREGINLSDLSGMEFGMASNPFSTNLGNLSAEDLESRFVDFSVEALTRFMRMVS
jgi:hypothetical protein